MLLRFASLADLAVLAVDTVLFAVFAAEVVWPAVLRVMVVKLCTMVLPKKIAASVAAAAIITPRMTYSIITAPVWSPARRQNTRPSGAFSHANFAMLIYFHIFLSCFDFIFVTASGKRFRTNGFLGNRQTDARNYVCVGTVKSIAHQAKVVLVVAGGFKQFTGIRLPGRVHDRLNSHQNRQQADQKNDILHKHITPLVSPAPTARSELGRITLRHPDGSSCLNCLSVNFHGDTVSLGRFHAKDCAGTLNTTGSLIHIIAHRIFHIPEFRDLPKNPPLSIKFL